MATHFIYSTIDAYESYALSEFLKENKGKDITIRISSSGGNVDEGITMYNLLKSHNGNVIAVVDGKCHSAAVLVFCGAKKRYMNEGSTMVLHPVTVDWLSDASADDLRKYADSLEQYEQIILDIYAKSIGGGEDVVKKLQKLMEQETTLTAQEAAEIGFCEIPKNPVYADKQVVEYINRAKVMNAKAFKELENYKKQETEELLKDVPGEAKKSVGIVAQSDMEEAKRMKEFILKNAKPSVVSRIQQEYANRSEWTLEEWRKKDPAGLEKMKKENPEYFNELVKTKK